MMSRLERRLLLKLDIGVSKSGTNQASYIVVILWLWESTGGEYAVVMVGGKCCDVAIATVMTEQLYYRVHNIRDRMAESRTNCNRLIAQSIRTAYSELHKLRKLDYCGITMLTVGSFVPWLYYSFYCHLYAKIAYLVAIMILGTACLVVSLWEKFSEPKYRPVRAAMFVALGLSGVVPAIHVIVSDGFWYAVNNASLGWLGLMAFLYIFGAVIYAIRIPERLLPGRFDLWFQSHQIFHVLVVAAALVHYHGIMTLARFRLTTGDCLEAEPLGDPVVQS